MAISSITDYTDLSGVTLTATGDSETIALDTGATYEVVVDGVMEETSLDDLLEGEMVAVITDSSGMQEVIVLETVVDNAAEDATDNASSVEDSAESSTLEETAGE